MKTLLTILAFVFLNFSIVSSQQWLGSSTSNDDIYRSGSIGLGISNPSYKIDIENGYAKVKMLHENDTDGVGDRLFKIYHKHGVALSINSFKLNDGKFITDLGTNYAVDGSNGTYQYAPLGAVKAPMIRLDATSGSISLFGEDGTGSNWRRIESSLNLGIHISNNGYVGIGTSLPGAPLYVNGLSQFMGGFISESTSDVHADLYCDNLYERSDRNLKHNVRVLEKSRVKNITKLSGYTYNYNGEKNKSIGVIAQEIEEYFPELVKKDLEGNLSVDYTGLIPVIIETLKQQQTEIEQLKNVLSSSSNLNNKNAVLSNNQLILRESNNILYQNYPNPVDESCVLKCNIEEIVNSAKILIFTSDGRLVKNFEFYQKGLNQVTIDSNELSPGTYFYSLIVDNVQIDTKNMLIVE